MVHVNAPALRWAIGIEDTFIPQGEPGRRPLDEYELQQHYRLWRRDIDLAAGIGFDMIRYGIPWYLVEPEPGVFEWSWTDQVVPYLVERGLEPIIDLVHYGTPLWLEHQFLNPGYPDRIASFAVAFADRYRGLVRYYTPLNEPFVTADLCGRRGRWPPGGQGWHGFMRVGNALATGIVLTVDALRSVRDDCVIVHVEDTGYHLTDEPALEDSVRLDNERHLTILELIQGRVGGDHALLDDLEQAGIEDVRLQWYQDRSIQIDVLGLNYYPDFCVHRRFRDDGVIRQENIWGGSRYLSAGIRRYFERYGLPMFITESSVNERCAHDFGLISPGGASREDDLRRSWLRAAVSAVDEARQSALPVLGFTWWPLLDLVNWDYREGTEPANHYLEPMGLFALEGDAGGRLIRRRLEVADDLEAIIAGQRGAPTVP